MIEDLSSCYHILELEPGSTLAEVKRSYRDLVKVWHPDRFPNDPKLQRKGEEKLKQINLAYDRICNSGSVPPRETPKPAHASAPQSMKSDNASNGGGSQGHRSSPQYEAQSQARRSNPKPPPAPETNFGRRFIQIAAIVVVILIVRAVFSTDTETRGQTKVYSPPLAKQHPESSVTFSPATPTSQQPSSKDKPEPLFPSIPVMPTSHESESGSPITSDSAGGPTIFPSTTSYELSGSNSVSSNGGYFTVGSTKDEVLAVQGTPTEFTDTMLTYEFSKVYFSNGRVTTWKLNSLSPLKVKLLPSAQVAEKGFFTVGSTKDEVLAVQGTPTEFTETMLTYEFSKVYFSNGRVTTWNLNSLSPLKVKLLPSTRVAEKNFFTVGSTKDEVLAVQGTPTGFTDTMFTYELSKVYFSNGRVTAWNLNYLSPLKVR